MGQAVRKEEMEKEELSRRVKGYESIVIKKNLRNFEILLKAINPGLGLKKLSKERMQRRKRVACTTYSGGLMSPAKNSEMLQNVKDTAKVWSYPFDLVFLISENDETAQTILSELSYKYELYPQTLSGKMAMIRSYAHNNGYDIVTDDDPRREFPVIVFPIKKELSRAGAYQPKISSHLFHDLWSLVLELGTIHGIPLVGMNGSDESQSCKEHNIRRSMCELCHNCFQLDHTITSAQGFATSKNFHQQVVEKFSDQRKIYQEYAAASTLAIHYRRLVRCPGTLILSFVKFLCRVNPPSEESRTWPRVLQQRYPEIVKEPRTVRNNNCIIRTKTMKHTNRIT
jgi:hypothetical protein